jgi:hypothetical protein
MVRVPAYHEKKSWAPVAIITLATQKAEIRRIVV